jgi:AcrR family transcriptional regulator
MVQIATRGGDGRRSRCERPANDRPPRAHAHGNRAKFLAAARSGFESIGPEANLRDIARRACVAQGTVHHFPTKQALFSAIFTGRLRELTSPARRLRAGHAPGEAFNCVPDGRRRARPP